MSTSLLHKAYDSALFQEEGAQLIALLSQHLNTMMSGTSDKVTQWKLPNDELAFWRAALQHPMDTSDLFQTVLERSIHVHHPKFIGHQIAPTVPVSALATLLSALLNNGMTVYEMGQASAPMEKVVIEWFTQAIGYRDGDGFLTSGGTLANLTAMLAARKAKASDDIWNEGLSSPLAIMVSEEAHYCIDRAARIMGLGERGIIKIPVNDQYAIRTDLLEEYYNNAISQGFTIIAIVGSAPSTSTGAYDDLDALSVFAKAHNLWFHIDGAHGGAAIFSSTYKHLLKGIDQADSIIIDGHKMMATSSITTAVLFKNGQDSYATFSQKAQYLWEKNDDEEWYNIGKRTFECTKSMMSLRFYAIINSYGNAFFDDFVTSLYNLGKTMGDLIKADHSFALFLEPQSNIVCFRYIDDVPPAHYDVVNKKIRQRVLEDGEFYMVSTQLKEAFWLRTTIMNPFTTKDDLQELLIKIKHIAKQELAAINTKHAY